MADISLTTTDGRVFTFAEGEIKRVTSNIDANLENMPMPNLGPTSSYSFDYEGVTKTITVTGILFSTGTSRVAGFSIDSIIEQKQWLESLVSGTQRILTFTSNYETLSVRSELDAVAPYQASFTQTKVKIMSLNFDEIEALTEELAFSMQLVVCNV